MSRKVKSASALSLVATLSMVLFDADGSSANAEAIEAIPAANAASTGMPVETQVTRFVSQPVVQTVPVSEPGADRPGSLKEFVATQPVPEQLDEQMRCLAGAIYFESKGESLAGQLAVGRVVVARAESSRFPSSYCGVVFQRSQFSFVRGGRMPQIKAGSLAWKRAKKLAVIAHDESWESPAEGALFFHANYVSPRWKQKLVRLAQIDNHIFYR